MVLQSECYPGAAYQQQSYATYQDDGHMTNGRYSNFPGMATGYTTQYSSYPQMSSYSAGNPQQHQSGWPNGAGHHGHGASHYSGGGMANAGMHKTAGYGSSRHGASHGHEGYNHMGGGCPNMMKYAPNSYGSYNHGPSGMNNGYHKDSWTLKGLEDED